MKYALKVKKKTQNLLRQEQSNKNVNQPPRRTDLDLWYNYSLCFALSIKETLCSYFLLFASVCSGRKCICTSCAAYILTVALPLHLTGAQPLPPQHIYTLLAHLLLMQQHIYTNTFKFTFAHLDWYLYWNLYIYIYTFKSIFLLTFKLAFTFTHSYFQMHTLLAALLYVGVGFNEASENCTKH